MHAQAALRGRFHWCFTDLYVRGIKALQSKHKMHSQGLFDAPNLKDIVMRVKNENALPGKTSVMTRMRWAAGSLALVAGLIAATTAINAYAEHGQDAQGEHHGWREHTPEPGAGMMMGMPMMGIPMGGGHMAHWFKRLNVTDAQKSQFEALAKKQHEDMMQSHASHQALHQEMLALLKQPTIDDASVQTLRAKVLAHHQEMMAKRWQTGVDMVRILNVTQRQQLADMLSKRMAHEEERHGMHDKHEDDAKAGEKPAKQAF